MNRTRYGKGGTPTVAARPALPAQVGITLVVTTSAAGADADPSHPLAWGIR